mgnify:FL=1
MSPAGTHGVLSGQINIRLSTCLIPEGAVVLKCEYLKGEHKRKGAFTCYRSGRKRAAISFWEASGNSAQSCTSTKIGMSLSRSAVRSASTARQGRKSAPRVRTIRSRSLPGWAFPGRWLPYVQTSASATKVVSVKTNLSLSPATPSIAPAVFVV